MLNAKHVMIARVAGLALAGGLILAGLVAAPALAGEPQTRTVEIRKVIHEGPGDPGKDGEAMLKQCSGEVIDIAADGAATADRKEMQKIKLCLKAGTKAETASRLEGVIADLDKQDDMDAAVKADLKSKLAARIAELRAGN